MAFFVKSLNHSTHSLHFSKNYNNIIRYEDIVEHPKFNGIIRNYMNRKLQKNQEKFSLEGILERARERYDDLVFKIQSDDDDIATDIFFAFEGDKEKCNTNIIYNRITLDLRSY